MIPQIRVWRVYGGIDPVWLAEAFDGETWVSVPGSWLSRAEADDAADLFAEKFMRIEVAG